MLTLITPPTELPLTLNEAKAHLRIELDNTEEDTYLEILIGAATEYVQNYTNRQLMPATYRLTLDSVPASVPLSHLPFAAITSIKAIDALGLEVVLEPDTDFRVNQAFEFGEIAGIENSLWYNDYAGISIEYTVGYAGQDAIPRSIKAALLLILGHLYTNREEIIVGTINGVSKFASEALLGPYRLITF